MAASPDATTRLLWRNALVEHNLALVRMVAQRHTRRSGQPFDDLVSAGGLGLIRAVEAFDLRQRCNFSSFAVPYMQGHCPLLCRNGHRKFCLVADPWGLLGQPLRR
ncbi:sigma factor [Cyanobium sp. ATX 6E8]|uniref:sigma factor n=1 Tax=Cyanobium sp. ATX 6E8 TaxID=2823701 RepID=UPI0020CF7200|nr:sigma factor [Cyanobium sp. ATX 6E8]